MHEKVLRFFLVKGLWLGWVFATTTLLPEDLQCNYKVGFQNSVHHRSSPMDPSDQLNPTYTALVLKEGFDSWHIQYMCRGGEKFPSFNIFELGWLPLVL